MLKPIRYPFDKTARSPDNFVQDEPHDLTPGRERRIVVPEYLPFYAETVMITDVATGQTIPQTDYYIGHFIETIQREVGKEVATCIVITNENVSDQITVSYQTVGGQYALSSAAAIREQINNLSIDSRPIAFDAIIGKPSKFVPAEHMHDVGDVYGFEFLVYAIDRLRDAILSGNGPLINNIYLYIDEQDDNLLQLVRKNAKDISDHESRKDNPHDVTAHQTGTYTSGEIDSKVNVVTDDLDDLRVKIYGTTDKTATKVIGSFMPPSPREGNLISWDKDHGGYYVGKLAVERSSEVYVDMIAGVDVGKDANPNHGSTPANAYKTIKFAIEQVKDVAGNLNFNLKAGQRHVLPQLDEVIKIKGLSTWTFRTYQDTGIGPTTEFNHSDFDQFKNFIKSRAATLELASMRDGDSEHGYKNSSKTLFSQHSMLEQVTLKFENLRVIVKDYNYNTLLQRINDSNLDTAIKTKAAGYYEFKAAAPVFKVNNINFTQCHLISNIQNRAEEVFHSLIGGDSYVTTNSWMLFSGKLWDLDFSDEPKSDLMIHDPDKVYVDDGSKCTVPTNISRSFIYLIDNLEVGNGHYHFVNLRTNIRPFLDVRGALEYSEDFILGKVSCPGYVINIDGNIGDGSSGSTDTSIKIGILYKDARNRVYIKPKDETKYYQIYPAIWQGDTEVAVKTAIDSPEKLRAIYQASPSPFTQGKFNPRFYAATNDNSELYQVFTPVWQHFDESPVGFNLNSSHPVKASYTYYDNDLKAWFMEALDRSYKHQVYPAQWPSTSEVLVDEAGTVVNTDATTFPGDWTISAVYQEPVSKLNLPAGQKEGTKIYEAVTDLSAMQGGAKPGVAFVYRGRIGIYCNGVLIDTAESKPYHVGPDKLRLVPSAVIDKVSGEITWNYDNINNSNSALGVYDEVNDAWVKQQADTKIRRFMFDRSVASEKLAIIKKDDFAKHKIKPVSQANITGQGKEVGALFGGCCPDLDPTFKDLDYSLPEHRTPYDSFYVGHDVDVTKDFFANQKDDALQSVIDIDFTPISINGRFSMRVRSPVSSEKAGIAKFELEYIARIGNDRNTCQYYSVWKNSAGIRKVGFNMEINPIEPMAEDTTATNTYAISQPATYDIEENALFTEADRKKQPYSYPPIKDIDYNSSGKASGYKLGNDGKTIKYRVLITRNGQKPSQFKDIYLGKDDFICSPNLSTHDASLYPEQSQMPLPWNKRCTITSDGVIQWWFLNGRRDIGYNHAINEYVSSGRYMDYRFSDSGSTSNVSGSGLDANWSNVSYPEKGEETPPPEPPPVDDDDDINDCTWLPAIGSNTMPDIETKIQKQSFSHISVLEKNNFPFIVHGQLTYNASFKHFHGLTFSSVVQEKNGLFNRVVPADTIKEIIVSGLYTTKRIPPPGKHMQYMEYGAGILNDVRHSIPTTTEFKDYSWKYQPGRPGDLIHSTPSGFTIDIIPENDSYWDKNISDTNEIVKTGELFKEAINTGVDLFTNVNYDYNYPWNVGIYNKNGSSEGITIKKIKEYVGEIYKSRNIFRVPYRGEELEHILFAPGEANLNGTNSSYTNQDTGFNVGSIAFLIKFKDHIFDNKPNKFTISLDRSVGSKWLADGVGSNWDSSTLNSYSNTINSFIEDKNVVIFHNLALTNPKLIESGDYENVRHSKLVSKHTKFNFIPNNNPAASFLHTTTVANANVILRFTSTDFSPMYKVIGNANIKPKYTRTEEGVKWTFDDPRFRLWHEGFGQWLTWTKWQQAMGLVECTRSNNKFKYPFKWNVRNVRHTTLEKENYSLLRHAYETRDGRSVYKGIMTDDYTPEVRKGWFGSVNTGTNSNIYATFVDVYYGYVKMGTLRSDFFRLKSKLPDDDSSFTAKPVPTIDPDTGVLTWDYSGIRGSASLSLGLVDQDDFSGSFSMDFPNRIDKSFFVEGSNQVSGKKNLILKDEFASNNISASSMETIRRYLNVKGYYSEPSQTDKKALVPFGNLLRNVGLIYSEYDRLKLIDENTLFTEICAGKERNELAYVFVNSITVDFTPISINGAFRATLYSPHAATKESCNWELVGIMRVGNDRINCQYVPIWKNSANEFKRGDIANIEPINNNQTNYVVELYKGDTPETYPHGLTVLDWSKRLDKNSNANQAIIGSQEIRENRLPDWLPNPKKYSNVDLENTGQADGNKLRHLVAGVYEKNHPQYKGVSLSPALIGPAPVYDQSANSSLYSGHDQYGVMQMPQTTVDELGNVYWWFDYWSLTAVYDGREGVKHWTYNYRYSSELDNVKYVGVNKQINNLGNNRWNASVDVLKNGMFIRADTSETVTSNGEPTVTYSVNDDGQVTWKITPIANTVWSLGEKEIREITTGVWVIGAQVLKNGVLVGTSYANKAGRTDQKPDIPGEGQSVVWPRKKWGAAKIVSNGQPAYTVEIEGSTGKVTWNVSIVEKGEYSLGEFNLRELSGNEWALAVQVLNRGVFTRVNYYNRYDSNVHVYPDTLQWPPLPHHPFISYGSPTYSASIDVNTGKVTWHVTPVKQQGNDWTIRNVRAEYVSTNRWRGVGERHLNDWYIDVVKSNEFNSWGEPTVNATIDRISGTVSWNWSIVEQPAPPPRSPD